MTTNLNDSTPDCDDFVHMQIGKAGSKVTRANFVDGFLNDVAAQQDGTPAVLIGQAAIDLPAAGRALLDDTTAAAQRATLGIPIFASVAAAAAATIDAVTSVVATDRYSATATGESGARYIRTSLATITAGGYPAASYFRSVDRFMLDGSTDVDNGGYWLIANLVLRPEMFGARTTRTLTTAALVAATDFMHLTHRTLVLTSAYGPYEVNGSGNTTESTTSEGGTLQFEGDVVIDYDATAAAIEYFWTLISTVAAEYSVGMSGGSCTIQGNSKVQRLIAIGSATGSTTIGGRCHVRGLRLLDVYAPAGSNGAAYALDIAGPFGSYFIEEIEVDGVSRHASLDATGDCKAVRVSQARVPVLMRKIKVSNVLNDLQDADAIFVSGPVEGGLPVAPLATFLDCEFVGINGRPIKTQARHTIVRRTSFDHGGLTTITNGADVSAQYGSFDVADCGLLVDAAPGGSYIPLVAYGIYNDASKKSSVRRFKGTTGYVLPRLVAVFAGANSPNHEVVVEDCEVVGTDAFATTVFNRCAVEFAADEVKASSKKLSLVLRNNTFQSNLYLVGYTGGDGTDISAKLGIHATGNKTTLATIGTSTVFKNLSGTEITKLTDYTFGANPGYFQHFPNWDVNFTTIKPGNDFTFDLAGGGTVVTSGPANLPATGVARVLVGAGETSWYAYLARDIILDDNARHWYTLTGTWVEKADRPMIEATATFDAASLALGASGAIQTIAVAGAALGDYARASLSIDLAGVFIPAWVSSANVVSYYAHNLGGANPVDLASATVKIRVEK